MAIMKRLIKILLSILGITAIGLLIKHEKCVMKNLRKELMDMRCDLHK